MAFRTGHFIITGGPTVTTSTSLFNIATVNAASLPGGIGALTGRTSIAIKVVVMMIGSDVVDHNSVHWSRDIQCSYTPSGNVIVFEEEATGNGNTNGRVGDANTSTISFATSGTSLQVQVTPDTALSCTWFARLDCDFIEYT